VKQLLTQVGATYKVVELDEISKITIPFLVDPLFQLVFVF